MKFQEYWVPHTTINTNLPIIYTFRSNVKRPFLADFQTVIMSIVGKSIMCNQAPELLKVNK